DAAQAGDEMRMYDVTVGCIRFCPNSRPMGVCEPLFEELSNGLPLGRERQPLLMCAQCRRELFLDLLPSFPVIGLPTALARFISPGNGTGPAPIATLVDRAFIVPSPRHVLLLYRPSPRLARRWRAMKSSSTVSGMRRARPILTLANSPASTSS